MLSLRASKWSMGDLTLGWDRLPLGDTAQLAFTVRDAEEGQRVTIEVLGADDQPVDQFEHQLTKGHGREILTWKPDDQAQADIRILQTAEDDEDPAGPSGLHFHVILNGNHSERSGPLLLTADLEVEHTDTQDKPLPEGTQVTLADAEGKLHVSHADSAGRTRFDKVLIGAVDWVFGSAQAAAETVRIADQRSDPSSHCGCQVLVGAPTIHLKAKHLPPPVMINLRDDAPSAAPQVLSEQELNYFREQGNNALLFVHGYNVPLGSPGQLFARIPHDPGMFVNAREAGWERLSWTTWLDWTTWPATVQQDPEALGQLYPRAANRLTDEALNGIGAHNWRVHMEHQLNRAAGFEGFDRDGGEAYTRILGVAWSGDVLAHDFHRSELNAQRAGRRLVPLLRQLHQAGIKINVITHSLGARVLLTALNILGEHHTDLLDHAFLWQPAVADNALSNSPASDPHPFKVGVFPYAHRAAKQFVVLHTVNDGILGGRFNAGGWARRIMPMPARGAAMRNYNEHTDPLEEAIRDSGGAYPKKWWPMPTAGLGGPLTGLYDEFSPLLAGGVPGYDDPSGGQRRVHSLNWRHLREALLDEMRRYEHLDLTDPDPLPEYHLLSPIATRGVIRKDHVECYLDQLHDLIENRFRVGSAPRSALGHVGFKEIRGQNEFIRDHSAPGGKFAFVEQDDWLFTHGGMKIPSDPLFEEVFKKRIMQQNLLPNSSFGKY